MRTFLFTSQRTPVTPNPFIEQRSTGRPQLAANSFLATAALLTQAGWLKRQSLQNPGCTIDKWLIGLPIQRLSKTPLELAAQGHFAKLGCRQLHCLKNLKTTRPGHELVEWFPGVTIARVALYLNMPHAAPR